MKKLLSFVIAGLVLTAVIGCTSTNEPKYEELEFPAESKGVFQLISEEPIYAGTYFRIVERGDFLFVFGGSQETHTAIHIYDKKTAVAIGEYLRYGRGPKEYLYDVNSYYDNNESVYRMYDIMRGESYTINLEALISDGINSIIANNFNPIPFNRCMFENEEYEIFFNNPSPLTKDTTTLQRIVLQHKQTRKQNSYNEFPIFDDDRVSWFVYNNSCVGVDSKCKRMVVATRYGGILEIFSIDKHIKLLARKYFFKPQLEFKNLAHSYTDETRYGFGGIYLTDSYIYGVYDGEIPIKQHHELSPKERDVLFKYIVVFDWEGNPIKRIITDSSITAICLSEDESTLYAVVKNNYGEAFLAKLDMMSLEK